MNYIFTKKVQMGLKSPYDITETQKEFALDILYVHTQHASFFRELQNIQGVRMDVFGDDYVRKVLQRIGVEHQYKWYAANQKAMDVYHLTHQTKKVKIKFLPDSRKIDADTTLHLCNQTKHFVNVTKLVKNLSIELKLKILTYVLGVESVKEGVKNVTLFRAMNMRYFRFRNCVDLGWETFLQMKDNCAFMVRILSFIPVHWGSFDNDSVEDHDMFKCNEVKIYVEFDSKEKLKAKELEIIHQMKTNAPCVTFIQVVKAKIYISIANHSILSTSSRLYSVNFKSCKLMGKNMDMDDVHTSTDEANDHWHENKKSKQLGGMEVEHLTSYLHKGHLLCKHL